MEKSPACNGAQAVRPGTAQIELTLTASAVNGNRNGKHAAPGTLAAAEWPSLPVACGIDTHYHHTVATSRTIAEVSCRQCQKIYQALTTLRGKARRWDRFAGHQPKRTYQPRPLVNVAAAFDRAPA